jgi:hypothetical protein
MGPCLGDVLERLITRQHHGIVQATLIARLPNFPGKSRSGRHTTAEMRQTA